MALNPARLDVFLRRVRLEVEHGPLPSAQVAVAHKGELVAFVTYGDATPESRYILQSVGRSVVAGTVWKLLDDGLLDLDEHVADIIPEFGANGKDAVKVRHVLTHTAGLPFAPLGYPKMLTRESRLAAFARWRLDYEPGTQFQFHLTSAAWILAELTERRTGLPFADYLRTTIVEPLGLGFVLPIPVERYEELVAVPIAIDRTSDDQEIDPWGPWYLANAKVLAGGEPSHSLIGTAADMAMFFQHVHHSGVWSKEIVEEATRPHVSMAPAGDKLYGGSDRITHLGLFVTVCGDDPGPWAPHTGSPRTWGNGGAPCQLAFHDPEVDTSFAFLTNGYPLAGYDYSRAGTNRVINIANLGNDLAG
ncbi:serine hydrolase domain-containing protein [Frankia sp. Cas4]|uniref:serine hydrolase domain-containing protein n=1 Tax=Frankia sp. Cas4 TaxID=3073927 RepID=UPI002AD51529|nr:serine hydrolase domain-containing protein [Frankia sp. Cas4]